MRGPVVYCGEAVDNGNDLRCIEIDTNAPAKIEEGEFILPSVTLQAFRQKDDDKLYSPVGDDYEPCTLQLIPYYAFANRGESEMLVWFLKK